MCLRVERAIECPECGYPASEALYILLPADEEAGIPQVAYDPIRDIVEEDPGHWEVVAEIGLIEENHT